MHDDETVDEMIRRRRGDPRPALLFEDDALDVGRARGRVGDTRRDRVRAPAARSVPHRLPARERPRAQLLARRRRGVWRRHGGHQPDPPRRRARRRHPPHRLPARGHRAQARSGCSTGSTSASRPTACLVVDTDEYRDVCEQHRTTSFPDGAVAPDTIALLVFTSGTSGAPKAALVSQRRLARYGRTLSAGHELTAESVCYMAMPMFHSNALYAGWSPAVYVGATIALRRRFSASAFLDDVRRYQRHVLQLRGQATAATSWPRRLAPTTACTRSCASSATRAPSATSRDSASASAFPSSTTTARPRGE